MSDQAKNEQPKFDVLGDILETLHFRGSIFFRSKLASPWGLSFSEMNIPRFHAALKGGYFIGVGGGKIVNVKHMDIVMLPHGDVHWIADQEGRELISSEAAQDACELSTPFFQQGELSNSVLCGLVRFEQELKHPFMQSLPPIMHFSNLKESDPIWATVMLIDAEAQKKYSSSNIVNRLTEVLFLQLLIKYADEEEFIGNPYISPRNYRIHQLLDAIHKDPQINWSLSLLGQKIGMSSATLNRRFNAEIGVAPMTYIANWRMTKAHHLIKHSNLTFEQIAEMVGFSSARTLNAGFVRHYNYTLSNLRKSTT